MNLRKKLLLWFAGILAALAGASALVVAGAVLVSAKQPGFSRLGDRVVSAYGRLSAPAGKPVEIETTLLQIGIDKTIDVPTPAHGQGGGLTSLGNELILLTNDGLIYAVIDGALVKTAIGAPPNHGDAYARAAQDPRYREYQFLPDRLRYNDILLFRGALRTDLIASYIEWVDEQQCYRNALARLTLPAGTVSLRDIRAEASEWTVITRTQPCLPIKKSFRALEGHMSGGRMTRIDTTHIALTSGDFHWDGVYATPNPDPGSTVALSQDPAAEYGKVLIVDVESGEKRILSSGNRNMQGIATTADGRLWTVEHGPRGGDELNLQEAGANYGWPRVTYGTQYSRLPWPGAVPYGRHDGYQAPAFAWVPSVALSGLTRLQGFNDAWDGDLLASSLAGQSLYRIRVLGGRGVYAERIPIGQRIRYVHQHSDGQVVLWTDSYKLIFMSAKSANLAYDNAWKLIDESPLDSNGKVALRSRLTACLECHSLQYGANEKAPSLAGVWGRRIGGGEFKAYSTALSGHGGHWDAASLRAFLANPNAFAPGTLMPDPGLKDPAVLQELVRILQSVNTTVE